MNNVIVEKHLNYMIFLSNFRDFACHIGKLRCLEYRRNKCFETIHLILLEFGMQSRSGYHSVLMLLSSLVNHTTTLMVLYRIFLF